MEGTPPCGGCPLDRQFGPVVCLHPNCGASRPEDQFNPLLRPRGFHIKLRLRRTAANIVTRNTTPAARASKRRWRLRNLESERARCRKWVRDNLPKVLTNVKAWRRTHPELVRLCYCVSNANRQAKFYGRPERLTVKQFQGLLKSYNFICPCCSKRIPLGPDHVKPLGLGGSNNIRNIQPLCAPCNRMKRSKTIRFPRPTQDNNSAVGLKPGKK